MNPRQENHLMMRRAFSMGWFCHKAIFIPSLILCAFGLSSCTVGPDFVPPEAPDPKSYIIDKKPPCKTVSTENRGLLKNNAGIAQYFRPDLDIPALWWEVFHSKPLNELICLGLQNSPNIHAAKAALRQARSNCLSTWGAVFAPLVTAQGSAQRELLSNAQFGGDTDVPNSPFSLYNAQVNVSYVLDIWGGGRRRLEGLAAQVEFQRFELEAAYLSLSTNIVNAAIQEASLRSQIEATQELIKTSENQLDIVKRQFTLGAVNLTDVLSQETAVLNFKASLPPLQKNLSATRHLLAVLVGEVPSEDILPKFWFDNLTLPKNLPLSLPSNLVCQRPDVRASLALLHQASANIGVATANMLPNLTLSGYYGWQGNHFNSLFTPSNIVWNYGAQVMQTIFQGGALYYARRAAYDGFEQASAQYYQTVLQAFQNVADTLRAIEQDAIALKAQTEAVRVAKRSLEVAELQFKLGAVNYLSLLNSQQQYQNSKINQIKAKAARFADTAALFQALGGGWWNKGCYSHYLMTKNCECN